jgi:hypothetical protein
MNLILGEPTAKRCCHVLEMAWIPPQSEDMVSIMRDYR